MFYVAASNTTERSATITWSIRLCASIKAAALLDIDFVCNNLSAYDMDFMYMCHINNRSVRRADVSSRAHAWDKRRPCCSERLCRSITKWIRAFLDLQDAIEKDVQMTQNVTEDTVYDPEIVHVLAQSRGRRRRIRTLHVCEPGRQRGLYDV